MGIEPISTRLGIGVEPIHLSKKIITYDQLQFSVPLDMKDVPLEFPVILTSWADLKAHQHDLICPTGPMQGMEGLFFRLRLLKKQTEGDGERELNGGSAATAKGGKRSKRARRGGAGRQI